MPSPASIKFVTGQSMHVRHGPISNKFRYRLDSVLIPVRGPSKTKCWLFSRNKFNLFSFHDKDHGEGSSIRDFADKVVDNQQFNKYFSGEIWLLAQPRYLGYVFNPVSFWFFFDQEKSLRAVVAEVNNTAAGRHFYICRHDDYSAVKPQDKIRVEKLFYVSPFQEISGQYDFKFQFSEERIGAWIDFTNGEDGVYATQTGTIKNLNSRALLESAIFRPFGALRVIALIHWQALKLKLKGGYYRKAPPQKEERITR